MAITARIPSSPTLGDSVAAQWWQHYRYLMPGPVWHCWSLLRADSQWLPCWDCTGTRHEAEQWDKHCPGIRITQSCAFDFLSCCCSLLSCLSLGLEKLNECLKWLGIIYLHLWTMHFIHVIIYCTYWGSYWAPWATSAPGSECGFFFFFVLRKLPFISQSLLSASSLFYFSFTHIFVCEAMRKELTLKHLF